MALELTRNGPLTYGDLPEEVSDGRRYDALLKRDYYARFGVASYWLVDPDEPSVTELLHDDETGEYMTGSVAVGDEVLSVTAASPLTVVPASLVD